MQIIIPRNKRAVEDVVALGANDNLLPGTEEWRKVQAAKGLKMFEHGAVYRCLLNIHVLVEIVLLKRKRLDDCMYYYFGRTDSRHRMCSCQGN